MEQRPRREDKSTGEAICALASSLKDRGHARYGSYLAVPDDIQGRPGLEFPHDHHFPPTYSA